MILIFFVKPGSILVVWMGSNRIGLKWVRLIRLFFQCVGVSLIWLKFQNSNNLIALRPHRSRLGISNFLLSWFLVWINLIDLCRLLYTGKNSIYENECVSGDGRWVHILDRESGTHIGISIEYWIFTILESRWPDPVSQTTASPNHAIFWRRELLFKKAGLPH